jgi:hypothetical protein
MAGVLVGFFAEILKMEFRKKLKRTLD